MPRVSVYFLALAGLFAAVVAAGAQDATLPYQAYHRQALQIDYDAHTLNLEEFLALQAAGAVILDLRTKEEYDQAHIKGALYLGSGAITADSLVRLVPDQSQNILIYCNNSLIPTRRIALTDIALPQFFALGYQNVYLPRHFALMHAVQDGTLPMSRP